jgi:type IV pilus assembly protein PilM
VNSILNKAALARNTLAKARISAQPGGRPPVALEITPDGVLAAAVPGAGQAPVYAYQPLQHGALLPGIGEPNLRDVAGIAAAMKAVLDQVSPRTSSVTLVIPDTVVRVFVLDFDSFPGKPAEALPVLRFRLRKMVPFDVEHAGLSYQVLVETKNETRVLAAVLPGPILAEYEGAVREAGYEPGAVLPSSLAALEAIDALEAVLIANISPVALTTTIANGQDLLLYRTLDLPADHALRLSEIRRGVAVAAAYYEDKLGAPPLRLHFAGSTGAADEGSEGFARWLEDPVLEIVDLATRPLTGTVTPLGTASVASVTGALAGVR